MHEVAEVLHILDVIANLLLTAVSPDPTQMLVYYIEEKLRMKLSQDVIMVFL